MRKFFVYMFFIAAIAFMASCQRRPVAGMQSNPAPSAPWISGTVTAIQQGKDGFTATLITVERKIYKATVSRSNLLKPEQYRSLKAGDQVSVQGDEWLLDGEKQVTVRAMK